MGNRSYPMTLNIACKKNEGSSIDCNKSFVLTKAKDGKLI